MIENEPASPEAESALRAVSDSIILARKVRGKSQAEVAGACGMSIGTYQAVERGAMTPTMRSYVKVLDYFGLAHSLRFVGASIFDDLGQGYRLGK